MGTRDEIAKARQEGKLFQQKITDGWKAIAAEYPEVIDDLNQYVDGVTYFYRRCAEEQEMHGLPLDDHRISSLLQQARACDIVRTYITSRIDSNVAQPIKNSK